MAKLDMNPGETMIGSGQMSLYQKQGLTKKPFQGNVFVTNQRACFKISMMPGDPDMNLPLEEIKGFSVGKIALFTAVTIHSKDGKEYPPHRLPGQKAPGLAAAGGRTGNLTREGGAHEEAFSTYHNS